MAGGRRSGAGGRNGAEALGQWASSGSHLGMRGGVGRSIAHRVEAPTGTEAAPLAWYAIDTRRLVAWDYGAVREA